MHVWDGMDAVSLPRRFKRCATPPAYPPPKGGEGGRAFASWTRPPAKQESAGQARLGIAHALLRFLGWSVPCPAVLTLEEEEEEELLVWATHSGLAAKEFI